MPSSLTLRLKLNLGPDIAIGPGKADLLEHIKDAGSIAAAGRRMGMSYRRAWLLVETMNGCFREPLVVSERGGSGGGAARLTLVGEEVLARFRSIEARSLEVSAADLAVLERLTSRTA